MQYCCCEDGHRVLIPAEGINDVVQIWCPYCQRIVQFTAVLMRGGILRWMPGNWRDPDGPDLYSMGVYVYN